MHGDRPGQIFLNYLNPILVFDLLSRLLYNIVFMMEMFKI